MVLSFSFGAHKVSSVNLKVEYKIKLYQGIVSIQEGTFHISNRYLTRKMCPRFQFPVAFAKRRISFYLVPSTAAQILNFSSAG